ncbi:sugar kinase [Lactococcus lactis]|uniref:2-dehydro-3-deoxygluconokinase n=1 Tax=Lactococcus lactis subsp. lactis TaxID=1360 RepID=A0A2N5WGF7_LACLL|nr:sugar kinase [Lactococcus lactis]PLW61311.1 2-dehydro-3-deoxygluconokinase [Lactococcus lactis subsp. lactis]
MAEFLTIGEPLVVLASKDRDTSLNVASNFEKFLAGAELNVAVGISRLEHKAAYFSKVGDDPFGNFIIEASTKVGIDVTHLTKNSKYLTGFYLKELVSFGDPEVAYFRKNSAAANLAVTELEDLDLNGVKLAHLSGIFPALSSTNLETFKVFNAQLNEANILTVFDPNLRPALWESHEKMVDVTNELARGSQIILPGINEGELLMGSREPEKIADFYLKQSDLTHTVVVKLGADGAFVKTKNDKSFTVPGFKVKKVIDTVGAGDGFAVGLESALLEGWPIEDAVSRACAVGALAVQSQGDSEGYPTKEELIEFFNADDRFGQCY